MGKIKKTLDQGDKIIENAESSLLNSLDEAEKAIFTEVIKIFNQVDVSGGKLISTQKAKSFLMSLDNRIIQALYNSKYKLGVQNLIKDYGKIVQNNIDIQKQLNNKTVTKKDLSTIQNLEVNNTLDRLLGSGINKDFIAPVRETLYRSITLGFGVDETKSALEDFILSKPNKASLLSRYVGQVARDSIMQFDGSIQTAIGTELNLNAHMYVGSLLEDSRDQCIFWVGKGILEDKALEEEIKTAIDRGTLTGDKPCSGMNPACTVQTFSIYRGGFNCRHRAIATSL